MPSSCKPPPYVAVAVKQRPTAPAGPLSHTTQNPLLVSGRIQSPDYWYPLPTIGGREAGRKPLPVPHSKGRQQGVEEVHLMQKVAKSEKRTHKMKARPPLNKAGTSLGAVGAPL